MKNLAIILARKNSKRLKGKNNLSLGGKSLIKRAIESSKKSKIYNKIIVSSDDPKILKLSKNFPDINFIKRKNSLAKDKIKVISVVLDIIKDYKLYSSVSLLLPTCPFRTSQDIQKAFKIFKKNYKNTLSVTDYDFPPEFALKKNGSFYSPIKDSPLLKNKTRSQEFISSLRPNGAIYISLVSNLLKNKNFYVREMNVYKMSKTKSIDIDTKLDFDLAKLIYKKYEKK